MKLTPRLLKFGLNIYGPYIGAGIRVNHISEDWRDTHVSMRLKWFNKNIKKVHFGGSLYSMVDPHLMLMLMQVLGKGYWVWDKSAAIHFVKPGKGTVHSYLRISDSDLEQIKSKTSGGSKYLHPFHVKVLDEKEDLVAKVEKILYIKKKPSS